MEALSKQLHAHVEGNLPKRVTTKTDDFNVAHFGAVDDGQHCNTEAFSACLDALVAAGGGRMVLPRSRLGIYRGNIVVPPIDDWMTVEIVGDVSPTPIVGTVGKNTNVDGTAKLCTNCSHVVIHGLESSGPAVISVSPAPGQYQSFSSVFVVIKNLEIRTFDNPNISGIDMRLAQQCNLQNIFVNTGVYSVQAALPTHDTSGIITPLNNNGPSS